MKKHLLAAGTIVLVIGLVYLFIKFTLPERRISPPGEQIISAPDLSVPQTREMDLYFADITGQRLSIERREVSGESREVLIRHMVEELIKGPAEEVRIRTLPESTLVRAVFIRDKTVWVDLGGAIQDEHPGGAWTEVLAVYSIVNTIAENLPDIAAVQILLNGRESETFAGHVDISGPLVSRVQLLSGEWE